MMILLGLTGEFRQSKLFILVAWNIAEFGVPSPQPFLAHSSSRLGLTRPSMIAKSIQLDYLNLQQSYPLRHLQPLERHKNFDAVIFFFFFLHFDLSIDSYNSFLFFNYFFGDMIEILFKKSNKHIAVLSIDHISNF